MRIIKRWFALMLTIAIALSDCSSMSVFATEDAMSAEASVSENNAEGLPASEDESTVSDGMPAKTMAEEESISEGETADREETSVLTKLPALHIGQIKEEEELPYLDDSDFKYDLPVSFEMSDSVVLFVNYNMDTVFENEEKGTLVWSILRGKSEMEEGSASLVNEKDDWSGFETVSDSPYFILAENEDEEDSYYQTVKLTATDVTEHEDYNYYIRAAYYPGVGEEKEEDFYAAATVPFLPVEDTDIDRVEDDTLDVEVDGEDKAQDDDTLDAEKIGTNELQDDVLDAEESNVSETQDDILDTEGTDADQTQGSEPVLEESGIGQGPETTDMANAVLDETKEEDAVGLLESDGVQQDVVEKISSLTLDKDSIKMHPGETVQVTATVVPADIPVKILWKSSDAGVATVDENGEIRAKAEGIAQITAECDDITAVAKVEVVRADTDKMLDLSGDIWVAGFKRESEDFVYTGQKITQDIRVYHNDILLKEKTDYTLSYKNNVNAAAYNAAKAPSVTITLKGQYSGSVTLYYTIKPMNINDIDPYNENASLGYEQAVIYSESLKIPNPDLTFGKTKLKVNKDFACDYTTLPEDYKNGSAYDRKEVYHYTVNGIGNFTGSFQMQLVFINDKSYNFGSAAVTLLEKQYEYRGTDLEKSDVTIKTVKLNNQILETSLYDYKVCAKEIAGAYVEVYPTEAGRNAGYRGSKKVNLKLVGDRKISDAGLGEKWQESIIFSQKVLDEKGGIFQDKTGVLAFGAGKETLTEGKDYTVKYSNAKKVGKVTATYTGKGRYTGTLRQKYEIKPNEDKKNFSFIWKNVTYEGKTLTVAYQKGGAVPDFILKDQDKNVLKYKTDYTVKLTNNTVPGTMMNCVVNGKGNYKGYSETVELKVTAGDISRGDISVPDKLSSTKQDAWKSKVTVRDVNGKQLAAGKDYKEPVYEYTDMESGQLPKAGSTVKVTVWGMGCYEGSKITGSYRIYENSISRLKIAIDAQEYTGKEIKLSKEAIHVYATKDDMDKKNELTEPCYEIVGYKNNIKAGTAKVTLHGIGKYGGTVTCSFKIQKKNYRVNRVEKISLDKNSLSMSLAEKGTLTAEITPKAVANPTINWSTSDSNIAVVEVVSVDGAASTAVISPKKEGSVTITATAQDGNKKAECKVTIVNAPFLKEAGQTIEGEVGEKYQLTVEWPESQKANTSSLVWESSNPEMVSVDQDGLLTMKKTGAVVIKLRVGKYVQQCYVVVKGEEVLPEGKALKYEKKPGTVDDTPGINELLRRWEHNPGLCDYLYLPAGVYWIDAVSSFGGIVLTDNQTLIMSPGTLLMAIGNNSQNYQVIDVFGRDNITISGGQIVGERNEHTGTGGEWGHGIGIYGCTNVHISNVEISQCWGDGIYLGLYDGWDADGNEKRYMSSNITVENCNLHHNRRNNLSITAADYVTIDHCQFNFANGTDPQFGIDIETNYNNDPCEHITISNSTFEGNAKGSMGIITPANDIRLENCTLDGAFYNMAGKNVVLHNTVIKGEIVDKTGGIRRE